MYKLFTETDILNIYNSKIKLNQPYFDSYKTINGADDEFLNIVFSNSNYHWKKRDFPRAITLLNFRDWILKHNITPKNLYCTDKNDPELNIIKADNIINIEYDGINNDLHNFNINNNCDFFLFNQTIEHLYNPFLAIKNIYNQLNEGGYVFTSVPTINIPHSTPIHFNGYSPMGLSMLFLSCGFNVLEIGQWGNFNYIQKLFSTHSWPGYEDIKENITNEEKNVCQCWILCQK